MCLCRWARGSIKGSVYQVSWEDIDLSLGDTVLKAAVVNPQKVTTFIAFSFQGPECPVLALHTKLHCPGYTEYLSFGMYKEESCAQDNKGIIKGLLSATAEGLMYRQIELWVCRRAKNGFPSTMLLW